MAKEGRRWYPLAPDKPQVAESAADRARSVPQPIRSGLAQPY
ncbi:MULTISPECIES: hypothetical protein [unclassified Caballeronia]|nr:MULTISPECIES: hypothetical protein [unclassified Caballeronia]MDR5753059.1 hypothetical protein [Caballeronia sp. LZ024]MDR5841942.1 hypothetical protein [Caballeronia sp. LZ031]